MVKELRERTSAGMMDCKKALVESDGDMEKAIEWLREKGLSQAAKKASRIAAEGVVAQYVNEEGTIGTIVEVNCETDFVAKTDNFVNFANNVAKHIALANPYVLQLHGFYLNKEEKTMRFDLVVSFDAKDRRQVLQEVREEVQKEFPEYELQIIIDTDFSE